MHCDFQPGSKKHSRQSALQLLHAVSCYNVMAALQQHRKLARILNVCLKGVLLLLYFTDWEHMQPAKLAGLMTAELFNV